ncbi:hypothetical protein J2T57_001185 [Natronocella acetinitrilica]|uniref:Uncharacterized protein n=1 Tax=Natronocella acetinitrilica TaxID=414046 RepID=A0AAE3G1Q8_9GAMM|nr:hypothetical protein [Natronocella acetinitrilica]MCP1674086.1 hypothetical protein [Natronocella acetinitrilica]
MIKLHRFVLLAALSITLAGCASLGESMCELLECPAPEPSPVDDSFQPAPDWLADFSADMRASDQERVDRYGSLRPRLAEDRCNGLTVRVAALHMTLPEPPQDDMQPVRRSLEQCEQDPRDQDIQALARLLLQGLDERRGSQETQAAMREQLTREQSRNAALEEQIEALRAIDQSIRERSR